MNSAMLTRRGAPRQRGFTLVELLISMIVLTVGLLALAGLLGLAIQSNGRNKVDSTATMLAQGVLEEINSTMLRAVPGNAKMMDCTSTDVTSAHDIDVGADAGATLRSSDGFIDFSQSAGAVTPGYQMYYTVCTDDPTTGAVSRAQYDVRWNIKTVTAGTYLVTVGAVTKGAPASNNNPRQFAFPSNLRLMIGPEAE